MAFIVFDEGAAHLNLSGWPPVVYFLLSNRGVLSFEAGDTLRNGVGEIQGKGYKRVAQGRPPILTGKIMFAPVQWDTAGPDWPTDVRSLVAATTPDNGGAAICAWQLSQARDMSAYGRTLSVTPSFYS